MSGRVAMICIASVAGIVALPSVRALTARSAPPPDKVALDHPPSVGDLAPDFVLTDTEGVEYRLSALRGKMVVLSFLCGCPNCTRLAATLESVHRRHRDVEVLGVMTKHPDAIREWARNAGATLPVLFDPFGEVEHQYDSRHCPRSWVIDANGKVIYVSSPGASAGLIAQGLSNALASKAS